MDRATPLPEGCRSLREDVEVVISRLFAFVAGGVVMTSMNEELPRERAGRFWWFVLGSTGYALVLLMV